MGNPLGRKGLSIDAYKNSRYDENKEKGPMYFKKGQGCILLEMIIWRLRALQGTICMS